VELDYVGNHGVELPGDLELDYFTAQDRALGSQLLEIVPNPYYGVINSGPLSLPQVTLGALVGTVQHFERSDRNQARPAQNVSIVLALAPCMIS
jgi:hypothetical protein